MDALLVHMARDVAGIVRGYLRPIMAFTRPFRYKRCMVCGVKHKRVKTNLCDKHADLCGICAGPHNRYSPHGFNCEQCREDRPWMCRITSPSEHLMARLYVHRDELDFGKLDERGVALQTNELSSYLCTVRWDTHHALWSIQDTASPAYRAALRAHYVAEEAYWTQCNHTFNQLLAAMEDRTYVPPINDSGRSYVPPMRIEKK